MTNWLEEAKKYEAAMLKDLAGWIQIPSVLDEANASKEAPLGQANVDALEYFIDLGKRDGFVTKNIDNLAGHIEYGSGNELVGVLGHSDVVPVGEGWLHGSAFSGTVEDGFIYGRGTQDDKGPMMAAYYAVKMLKDLGLPLSKRIRLIDGTDEESGWRCVDRYFATEEMPDTGFSPDANFPLIYAEKGMLNFNIVLNHHDDAIISLSAGDRSNMVPEDARVEFRCSDNLEVAYQAYLDAHKYEGTFDRNGDVQVLTIKGKAVHGMQPALGVNALYILFEFLDNHIESPLINLVQKFLDTDGTKFGISHSGVIGDLTINAGVFSYGNGKFDITVNLRHSQEWDADAGLKTMTTALAPFGAFIENAEKKAALYVPQDDVLIETLAGVYRKQTGDMQELLTTGGGTYARVMKKGVAFGMLFEGTEDRMHQTDERVPVADLIKAIAIYAESLYELAK